MTDRENSHAGSRAANFDWADLTRGYLPEVGSLVIAADLEPSALRSLLTDQSAGPSGRRSRQSGARAGTTAAAPGSVALDLSSWALGRAASLAQVTAHGSWASVAWSIDGQVRVALWRDGTLRVDEEVQVQNADNILAAAGKDRSGVPVLQYARPLVHAVAAAAHWTGVNLDPEALRSIDQFWPIRLELTAPPWVPATPGSVTMRAHILKRQAGEPGTALLHSMAEASDLQLRQAAVAAVLHAVKQAGLAGDPLFDSITSQLQGKTEVAPADVETEFARAHRHAYDPLPAVSASEQLDRRRSAERLHVVSAMRELVNAPGSRTASEFAIVESSLACFESPGSFVTIVSREL